MAIYHLHVNTGTRQGGQSAGAKSDYINRAGQYDRDDLVYAASGNIPVWAAEPGAYWQAADVYERVNGRLFKEVEGALPRELPRYQQRKLAQEFVRAIADPECLPYSLAIHSGEDESGEDESGERNPHFHAVFSERRNDNIPRSAGQWFRRYNPEDPAKGGARKTDSLKPHTWLERTRKLWADLANAALERAGHDARIDHRTLEAQGIERVPQIHLGPNVAAMERRGIRTDRGDRYREITAANEQIAALVVERMGVEMEYEWTWWTVQAQTEAQDVNARLDAWQREIEAIVGRQAREDEERQRAESASPWPGTSGAAPSAEAPDGPAPTVAPRTVPTYPGQQDGAPRQVEAALCRQRKDQAQRAGRANIESSGLTDEMREQSERMADEDGCGDRIRFCDEDLEAAMKPAPAPSVLGPKVGP